jgi:hypothetical protein
MLSSPIDLKIIFINYLKMGGLIFKIFKTQPSEIKSFRMLKNLYNLAIEYIPKQSDK